MGVRGDARVNSEADRKCVSLNLNVTLRQAKIKSCV
jgi:hypothetical protein